MKRFICAFVCLIVATSCNAMRIIQPCNDYDEHLISGVTQYYVLANKGYFIQKKSGYFESEGGNFSIRIVRIIHGVDANIRIVLANGVVQNLVLAAGAVHPLPAGVGIKCIDNNTANDVILRVEFERPVGFAIDHQPGSLPVAYHYN